MFGVAVWKWFVALVVLSVIAGPGIPVISPVAGLVSIVPGLVIVLVILRFFARLMFGGSGSDGYNSTGGTAQHDAILRRAGRL